MKIKNYEMVGMLNILSKYAEKRLPQKISYAITRNIITLQKDYECYIESLKKIYSNYDSYIVRDKDGEIKENDNGIPIVENIAAKDFNEEVSSLLNIEIDTNIFHIPNDAFDFEDGGKRYDALSAMDIINLEMILCVKATES